MFSNQFGQLKKQQHINVILIHSSSKCDFTLATGYGSLRPTCTWLQCTSSSSYDGLLQLETIVRITLIFLLQTITLNALVMAVSGCYHNQGTAV